ncbi:hypothetical protein L8O33_12240, partial [Enterobacter asburiae]
AVDVIAPANAVQLRQAVVRDLLSGTFERVTGSVPAPQLLTGQRAVLNEQAPGAVVLPAAGPAERRRALGIAGKNVPAMQSTKAVVFTAGGQQPLRSAGLKA